MPRKAPSRRRNHVAGRGLRTGLFKAPSQSGGSVSKLRSSPFVSDQSDEGIRISRLPFVIRQSIGRRIVDRRQEIACGIETSELDDYCIVTTTRRVLTVAAMDRVI